MFLFAVSLWLERLSLDRAERAVRSLMELAPNVAHRMLNPATTSEKTVDVNPAELAVGESVLVRPGDRVQVEISPHDRTCLNSTSSGCTVSGPGFRTKIAG